MKHILAYLFLAFLLVSCSSTYRVHYSDRDLESYIGKSHQELVEALGAPSSQISDGGKGYILVFEGNKELFDYSSKYAAKSPTRPQAQFFMGEDGICRDVKTGNTDKVKVTSAGKTITLGVIILLIVSALSAAS